MHSAFFLNYRFWRPALFLVALGTVFFITLKQTSVSPAILTNFSWGDYGFWTLLMVLGWCVNSEKLRTVLKTDAISLTPLEALRLTATSSVFNYLPLQGGALFRAIYLQKHFGLSYGRFITHLAAIYFIMIVCNFFSAALLGFYLFPDSKPIFLVFLAVCLLAMLLLFLPSPAWAGEKVKQLKEGILPLILKKSLIYKLLVLEIASIVLETGKFWLIISCLKLEPLPNVWFLLFLSAVTLPSVIMNITPAGIGIREGTFALAGWFGGIQLGYGIIYGGVDRLLTLFFVFTFGSLLAYRLFFAHLRTVKQPVVN